MTCTYHNCQLLTRNGKQDFRVCTTTEICELSTQTTWFCCQARTHRWVATCLVFFVWCPRRLNQKLIMTCNTHAKNWTCNSLCFSNAPGVVSHAKAFSVRHRHLCSVEGCTMLSSTSIRSNCRVNGLGVGDWDRNPMEHQKPAKSAGHVSENSHQMTAQEIQASKEQRRFQPPLPLSCLQCSGWNKAQSPKWRPKPATPIFTKGGGLWRSWSHSRCAMRNV